MLYLTGALIWLALAFALSVGFGFISQVGDGDESIF